MDIWSLSPGLPASLTDVLSSGCELDVSSCASTCEQVGEEEGYDWVNVLLVKLHGTSIGCHADLLPRYSPPRSGYDCGFCPLASDRCAGCEVLQARSG